MDTSTLAIRTVTITRTDSDENHYTPKDLAEIRRGGRRAVDYAAGRGLVPRTQVTADELAVPRGRWTMVATTTLELDDEVLNVGFDLAAGGASVPAALGPRRPADQIAVAAVASVESITSDESAVLAQLVDGFGEQASLRFRPDPLAGGAAAALTAILSSGTVSAIAGRWKPAVTGSYPVVSPTAVWWSGGVYLPQLGLAVGDEPPTSSEVAAASRDPWDTWWQSFAETLGRLVLTGAKRGASQSERGLADVAAEARSYGLERCADLSARILEALPYPDRRLEPFLEACVLLAFRE